MAINFTYLPLFKISMFISLKQLRAVLELWAKKVTHENKHNTNWKSGKQGPNQQSRFINFFLSWLADCSVNCDSLKRGSEHTYWNVFDGEDDLRHVSGRQKTPDGDL